MCMNVSFGIPKVEDIHVIIRLLLLLLDFARLRLRAGTRHRPVVRGGGSSAHPPSSRSVRASRRTLSSRPWRFCGLCGGARAGYWLLRLSRSAEDRRVVTGDGSTRRQTSQRDTMISLSRRQKERQACKFGSALFESKPRVKICKVRLRSRHV